VGNVITGIIVLLSSTVKFMMGSLTAVAAGLGIGGPIMNILGGIIGILVFTHLGANISEYLVKTWPERFGRKFTKMNRRLVRVKSSFGLAGVAFLTPIVLSIPVGIFFSLSITNNKKHIIWSMITACVFWSTVIFVPYFVFKIDVMQLLKHLFNSII